MQLDTSIECVLFDLDGTLIDTAPDFFKVVNQLAAENSRESVSREQINQTVSDGARALVRLTFDIEENHPEFADLNQRLLDLYYEQLGHTESILYPGMPQLLQALQENDIPWGIVTNKPQLYSVKLLEELGLADNCKTLVCPDHVQERKPHPEPIFLALQQLQVGTERTVYLGDNIRDIQAAKNADVIAIAASYGYLSADAKVEEWYADFILQSPEQAINLLNMLKFA